MDSPVVGKKDQTNYPPLQKSLGVSPGMNAPGLRSRSGSFGGVSLDGPSVARRAKEGELLRWIPPKNLKYPGCEPVELH